MKPKTKQKTNTYLGLLECPLRKGYIEFEYQHGDTIAELKEIISKIWGQPIALGDRLNDDHHGGLIDAGLWAVLCEDEAGAYVALSNEDKIPHVQPRTTLAHIDPHLHPNLAKRFELPTGLIYDMDIGNSLYNKRILRYFNHNQVSNTAERGNTKPHLNLGLIREYQIPLNKKYAVKLLALVTITGG